MKIDIDAIRCGVNQAVVMFNYAERATVIVDQTLAALAENDKYFDKERGVIVPGPKMGEIQTFLTEVVQVLRIRSLVPNATDEHPLIRKLCLKSAVDDMRKTLGLNGSLCESEGEDEVNWADMHRHLEGLDCTVQERTATEEIGHTSASELVQPGFWSGGNATSCELTRRVQVLEAELESRRKLIRELTNQVMVGDNQASFSEIMRIFLGPDEVPSTPIEPQGAPECDHRPAAT